MLLNLFQKNSKLILWGIPLITRIRQRNHTHTHTHARTHARTHTRTHARTHARTERKLQAYASQSIPESFQTPCVQHHTNTKIRQRNHTHTHTQRKLQAKITNKHRTNKVVWLETPTTPEGLFPCGRTDGPALSKPGCWKEWGKKLFVASGSFPAPWKE